MVVVYKDGFVVSYKGICNCGEEDLKAIRTALFNVLQYGPNDVLSDDDRCELVGLLRLLTEEVEEKEGEVPTDGKVLV